MANTVAVLGLLALLTVGIGVIRHVRKPDTESRDEPPVLPARYESLLHTDPSKRAGYCPECGTENDPEFAVCRKCSSRLPTQGRD